MEFRPQCLATAIGSFPHKDAGDACDLILKSIPEIPVWPQLPAIDFREGMEIQYSEGLPRVVIDDMTQRMYFDTSGDPSTDLAAFYDNYLAGDTKYFGISQEFARGVYEMEKRLPNGRHTGLKYFKNHVNGPVTLVVEARAGKIL